jgi:hypothetical protein
MSTRFARIEKPETGMPTAGEKPFSLDIFLLGEQKKVSRGAGRSARGLKDFRFRFQVYTRKDQNQHPWVSPPDDDLLSLLAQRE